MSTFSPDDFIRVSCVGFCRIRDTNGRYLLALNDNRQKIGQEVLAPFGGAYVFDADAPLAAWEPTFPKTDERELRFILRRTFLPKVVHWFRARQQRELDPFRELQEELVDETHFIDALDRDDVLFRHTHTLEYARPTMRAGQGEMLTHYFIELFDVDVLSSRLRARLAEDLSDAPMEWVSREDIERGVNASGTRQIDAALLLDTPV